MNYANNLGEQSRQMDETIRSAQGAVHQAVDQVADKVADGAQRVAGNADRLVQRGADAWHQGTDRLREQARHASDWTTVHVREQPLKSLLIAGALGAVLAMLLSPSRSRY